VSACNRDLAGCKAGLYQTRVSGQFGIIVVGHESVHSREERSNVPGPNSDSREDRGQFTAAVDNLTVTLWITTARISIH